MPGTLRILPLALAAVSAIPAHAQTMKAPDITKHPTLYVVPYAHLDTQWRWEMPQTISEYLLKTMRVNFDYMDKYPHYVFNWSGSNRYRLMKEYYPADYARLKNYVTEGRWFPAGSSVEEGDVNLPSAESIFRQVLYGNTFFRQRVRQGQRRVHAARLLRLPRLAAHHPAPCRRPRLLHPEAQRRLAARAHVGGPDSPEKTPEGIPFNVGVWKGPDGKTVLAALNPGSYGSEPLDLSKAPILRARRRTGRHHAAARLQAWSSDWPARVDTRRQSHRRLRRLPLRRHRRHRRSHR